MSVCHQRCLVVTSRQGFRVGVMQEEETYTIGDVAAQFGLTVRTLRYWDQIGLVVPSYRDWQDFRQYTESDMQRIHDVLTYRAVGLKLQAIRELLDDPSGDNTDVIAQLRMQRRLLLQQQDHISGMLNALDTLLEEAMSTHKVPEARRKEIMGEFYRPELEAEAEEKYGHTEEWAQAMEKQKSMSEADWAAMREKTSHVQETLADAMRRGVKPGSAEANELAEMARESLDWFPVTHSKHVILARSYVADPRFKQYYDGFADGLAVWLRDIIEANAQAHGVDLENVRWQ